MKFVFQDFASEMTPPKGHHTAQSVWCFHNDPYVYYRTYVQDKLPKPPIIRNSVEMLYKYELLLIQIRNLAVAISHLWWLKQFRNIIISAHRD